VWAGVVALNGSFWPWERSDFSGEWVDDWPVWFCCISATQEPLKPYNLVPKLNCSLSSLINPYSPNAVSSHAF